VNTESFFPIDTGVTKLQNTLSSQFSVSRLFNLHFNNGTFRYANSLNIKGMIICIVHSHFFMCSVFQMCTPQKLSSLPIIFLHSFIISPLSPLEMSPSLHMKALSCFYLVPVFLIHFATSS